MIAGGAAPTPDRHGHGDHDNTGAAAAPGQSGGDAGRVTVTGIDRDCHGARPGLRVNAAAMSECRAAASLPVRLGLSHSHGDGHAGGPVLRVTAEDT